MGRTGLKARLRQVERAVDRIETRHENLATREDIANLKVQILAAVPVLIGITAAIVYYVSQ